MYSSILPRSWLSSVHDKLNLSWPEHLYKLLSQLKYTIKHLLRKRFSSCPLQERHEMIKRPLVATMISTIWTTPSPSQSPRQPPTVAKNSVGSNFGKYFLVIWTCTRNIQNRQLNHVRDLFRNPDTYHRVVLVISAPWVTVVKSGNIDFKKCWYIV